MKILAQVECLKGSKLKYEIDNQKRLVLDRVISIPFPAAYGSIPSTIAPDGDPMDVFIINLPKGVKRGAFVMVRFVGIIRMTDNGVQDDKLLAMVEGGEDFQLITAAKVISDFLKAYKSGVQLIEFNDNKQTIANLEAEVEVVVKLHNNNAEVVVKLHNNNDIGVMIEYRQ